MGKRTFVSGVAAAIFGSSTDVAALRCGGAKAGVVRRAIAALALIWVPGAPTLADGDSGRVGVGEEVLVERECDTPPDLTPMRCYWLEVPERRDVPGARTLRLWVAVLGESDRALPPVVDIYGGPGVAASASWVHGDLRFPPVPGRVLITMDARGVGRSEPRLSCAQFDGVLPPTAPWTDRVAQQRLLQASCREHLTETGADLDGYDTVETAADFVALRRALGVDRWVLRGSSYAGRLAREVYRQDPDAVEAMVLFSPLTTAPLGPAHSVEWFDLVVERITAACDAEPTCAALGDFATNLATGAARLDASPFSLPDGGVVDGGVIYGGLVQALYRIELTPLLPAIAAQLAAGDTSILSAMAGALNPPPPDDERDVPSDLVFNVVFCADEGAALTDNDRAVLADPGPWTDAIGPGWFNCDVWGVDPVPGGRLEPAAGDVPVLVVSGWLDPATPPEFADEVVAGFPHTTTLIVPAGGHSSGIFVDCTRLLSVAFVLDPTGELDTSCVDDLPQPFSEP